MEHTDNTSKELELIDELFTINKELFNMYSIEELKSIIKHLNYDRVKVNYYLNNLSKEEIQKEIEADTLNKQSCLDLKSGFQNKSKSLIKSSKKEYILVSKNMQNIDKVYSNKKEKFVWESLLNKCENLIDLQDALMSYDKSKLYNKIRAKFKEAQRLNSNKNKAILSNEMISELNKQFEAKEKKIYSRYCGNLESNDIYYLKKIRQYKSNANNANDIKNDIYIKLFNKLISFPKNPRNIILSFLDIFTLGNLLLTNKILYKMVINDYYISKYTAKIYISALFANSNIYEINRQSLKLLYHNNFYSMFKNKPRIRFNGIYYCKVNSIREVYKYGEGNKASLVVYYRFIKFFPNGEVYVLTTPFYKTAKIKMNGKSGVNQLNKGTFNVKNEDDLFVFYDNGDEYHYKIGWSEFSKVRLSCYSDNPAILMGIELVEYRMCSNYNAYKKGKEKVFINVKLDENFPRRFKYRGYNYLNNDTFIHAKNCEIVDEYEKEKSEINAMNCLGVADENNVNDENYGEFNYNYNIM